MNRVRNCEDCGERVGTLACMDHSRFICEGCRNGHAGCTVWDRPHPPGGETEEEREDE